MALNIHQQTAEAQPLLTMRGIVKRFNRTTALAGVDFSIKRGEVHALVGENGAGKSTLMHILAGVLQPDTGHITLNGQRVQIPNVASAYRHGIAMVHQHFMLLPSLTAAENLTLGQEPRRRGLFDRKAAARAVVTLGERYGLVVNPDARVADLSVGDLQRLEILRALYRGAEILILDEPTGVLTPQEAQGLFRVIRELAADGKTTIFISHKLDEILDISQAITVLRDGHITGHLNTQETNASEIARMMVGRDVFFQFDRPALETGDPALDIRHLHGRGVRDVSLTVRAHEIVGIAGVTGSGQTELADMIAGLQPVIGGEIRIAGQPVTRASVAQRRAIGLANIPEDRYRQGLAPTGSISDNLLIGSHDSPPLAKRGLLNLGEIQAWSQRLAAHFQVKTADIGNPVASLSGGNAQRIVIARELLEDKPLIVAAQPTRGIDIAASEFVREALIQRRNAGAGVLLISADLGEILSISDRILVMYNGEIIGELAGGDVDNTRLGLLMAGVRENGTHV